MSRSSWPFLLTNATGEPVVAVCRLKPSRTHAFGVFKLVGLCRWHRSTADRPCAPLWVPALTTPHHPVSSWMTPIPPFPVFVRTEPPPHLHPPDRGRAETDLERAGMFVIYVLVGAVCQKCQRRQFFEDNETLLLADVCPSNTRTLPAKNCVSQTRPPYRG